MTSSRGHVEIACIALLGDALLRFLGRLHQIPRLLMLAWGRDDSGAVKGDGLVTYLKAPSVDLAVQIIDGTPLRDGIQQLLSVSQARCNVLGTCCPKCACSSAAVSAWLHTRCVACWSMWIGWHCWFHRCPRMLA